MVTVPPRAPGPGRFYSLTLAWSWPFPFPADNVIPQGGAGPCAFSVMSLEASSLTESRLGLQGPQGCAPSCPPPSGTFHVITSARLHTLTVLTPGSSWMEPPRGQGSQAGLVVVRGVYRAAPDAGEGLGSGNTWVRAW